METNSCKYFALPVLVLLLASIKMLKLNKFFPEARKYPCPKIKRQNRANIQIIYFFDKFIFITPILQLLLFT